MNLFIFERATPNDLKQGRLMQIAVLFMLVYAAALTLAPAARYHSWDAPYRWNHWIGFAVWLVGSLLVHYRLVRHMLERDPYIFPIVAVLSGWGLLTIFRLNGTMGLRQTLWLAICMALLWVGIGLPVIVEWLRRYKYVWLISGLLLTALTFVLGVYPGGIGPRLWLGCCGLYFQPSELLKLLLIVYLAAYLADWMPLHSGAPVFLVPTVILGGAVLGLVVAQRDLGTASLFIVIYTVVVYLAFGRKRILLVSGLMLLIAAVVGYSLFDVVRIRVDAWLNPWLDPSGRSFQIVQSLLSVAAGGIFGRGPGLGSPGVVPLAHSDFVFAAIAEENGLLGAAGLLMLVGLLAARGFFIALRAPGNYRRYLAAGIATALAAQAILIIGGNLRVLPLTGVTLPFVSYGGSSLLTSFAAVLLLLRISYREDEAPAPLPKSEPYLLVSGAILLGLAVLALTSGWWAGWRADELLARPDNPRWRINDRFVLRGALIDRNNNLIDYTTGQPGSYQRLYTYPALSNTTGYVSGQYGLAGLETALDDYLRGLRGVPASRIWWDNLLYGQTPPGLNVRLTLDLNLQRRVDPLLEGRRGAAVLLNSQTGEILALASHPYPDPARIDQDWSLLLADSGAPLLNRATQGQYPPGTALGPFILAAVAQRSSGMPGLPQFAFYPTPERIWQCARDPVSAYANWGELVKAGCPGALVKLAETLPDGQLDELFQSLGFYQKPDVPLVTASAQASAVQNIHLAAIGQENLVVSPLQMALAAAALSNNGFRPAPAITSAVQTTTQGWVVLPAGNSHQTILSGGIGTAQKALQTGGAYWEALGAAYSNQTPVTWYLGGTLSAWQGAPLAVVVVLEEDNPTLATEIGRVLLQMSR